MSHNVPQPIRYARRQRNWRASVASLKFRQVAPTLKRAPSSRILRKCGTERLLDDVVERVRFDIGDDSRDLPLPGNTSAGSCSCRHPPRATKTSGLSSRPSRTPARTLPPARTLLPPVSASRSPGRPTQSRPPPDVDSHATPAAFLRDFARPPRARHLAPQCQEVIASMAARRARPS